MPPDTKTLVSIIMPAYNAATFIGEAMDSVLSQTFKSWELIIINDGSTDDTPNICREYQDSDSRIKYYYQDNGKQGKARNLGLSHAQGQLVAFLDADDVWLPDKLALQTQQFQTQQVDMLFGDAYIFESLPFHNTDVMHSYKGLLYYIHGVNKMLEINRVPALTALVKRDALTAVNGFSEKPEIQNAEDYHLWLKLLMNRCKLFGSEETVAAYRLHSNAATSHNKLATPQVIECFYDLIKTYPRYRKVLRGFLKSKLKDYHYSTSNWSPNTYEKLIAKTCTYLDCRWLSFIATSLYRLLGLRAVRKGLAITLLTGRK